MPAAAVIPAPIAYIKVVAVKKLVVGFWAGGRSGLPKWCVLISLCLHLPEISLVLPFAVVGPKLRIVYFEKIRVFKAGRLVP